MGPSQRNFCCILYSVTSCSDTMADTRALHARLLLDYNYTLHAKRLSLLRVLALAFRSAPQSIHTCHISPHGSVHNGEATHDARGERCVAAYERRYS